MLNMFKIRKVASLVLMGMLPSIIFFVMIKYYGLLMGIIGLLIGVLITYFLSSLMLKNPFTDMLEGKGILCINMDSTGVLRPFIVSLSAPYIKGILNKKEVNDVWDREATFNMAAPKKLGKAEIITEKIPKPNGADKIVKETFRIELDEEEYNKGRFALFQYPVIIWNEQTNSILTKDFFAEKEKNSFAEHGVLYLNRKMEELTSAMLNFGRYVVEQLKPKGSLLQNKWVVGIAIFLIILLLVLFAGPIIESISGVAGNGALKGLSGAINPN